MKNDPVVIKGSREGIFLHLDPQTDFQVLKEEIKAKLTASKNFLAGAQVICDFGTRAVSSEEIAELEELIISFKLKLKRFNNSAHDNAGRGGRNLSSRPLESSENKMHPYADEHTLLITRTLRSGQSVNYEGNIVVMGDVNPGAEIIAGGNVIVMGALRGVVHAGAMGDPQSVVTAIRLKPTQLRIADQITRAPDDDLAEPDVPEIARIRDGIVTIEQYVASERQTRTR